MKSPVASCRLPAGRAALLGLICLACAAAGGQAVPLQKAVAMAAGTIYLSPDPGSAVVGTVQPGMDVGIQQTSGDWVQVFTGVSGWMRNRGLARLDDPAAPEALFGAAVQLEDAAEDASGERQQALDAARIYLSVYNDFPATPRAVEALYRSADIGWQVKMGEEPKRRNPHERLFPDDSGLRRVVNKYPDTPWAARAAYSLLVERFTCGDWFAKPECVGKEINTYNDYVKRYPQGPMTAEAAYDALYREAIAWTLYTAPGTLHDAGKAADYQRQVAASAATMATAYRGTDWAALAALVAFNVGEGTPMKVPTTTPLGGP